MWPFLIMWSFLSLSWCSWDIWTLQSSILVLFSFSKWLTLVLWSYNSKFLLSKELILLFLLPVWLLKSIKSSSYFFSLSKFSKSSISFCLLQTDSLNFTISSESSSSLQVYLILFLFYSLLLYSGFQNDLGISTQFLHMYCLFEFANEANA